MKEISIKQGDDNAVEVHLNGNVVEIIQMIVFAMERNNDCGAILLTAVSMFKGPQ
jgi:hypothetical protein